VSEAQLSKFFCHSCSREFDSQTAESGEEGLVQCPFCKGDFCEELENTDNGHFLLSNDGTAPELRPADLSSNNLTNNTNSNGSNVNNQTGSNNSMPQGLTGIGSLFSSLLGQPTSGGQNVIIQISHNNRLSGQQARSMAMPMVLSQILSSTLAPNPDAVSDANFENLLDFLMRNDPNSYGNPPASEDSIQKLAKIKMTAEDIKVCNECTVCQETFEEGEEIMKLPCEHYFHENCVTTWLKMHNSCPTCRKEIPGEATNNTQAS